jgi:hypothetical protein
MKIWIARDLHTGMVHAFEYKPIKDGDMFLTRYVFSEGFPLGKRPKLTKPLKRGHVRKTEIGEIT